MKLKYKKIILLTTMSTMGIGLLTLSISRDYPKAEESIRTGIEQEQSLVEEGDNASIMAFTANDLSEESLPELEPTPIPTPTPAPVYNFEDEDKYPEIKKLINDYYVAKQKNEVGTLKKFLSDPEMVDSKEELKSKTEFIEDYKNIKCYIKKSKDEGSFIVYVYYEIKFISVKTAAPCLSRFYIVTDESGEYKILSGEIDSETKEYYDERNNDQDVLELVQETNQKSEVALENDKLLKHFWDELLNWLKNSGSVN